MSQSDKPRFVTMITDASHCPHTRATGWAVWIKHGAPAETIRESGGLTGPKDSHQAERHALDRGVEILKERVSLDDVILVVQSDCQGALNKVGVAQLKALGARYVKLKWVKGHQGVKDPRSAVNTWCDKEAKAQMRRLRDQMYLDRGVEPSIYAPSA
ncbi:hypothetical protein [Modicisalibacter sp. MOD 31.J]|uniref:hypothetical protein n=1 Tax=Modicisalibacter sp. MOD 31.J TaxID=2831897 RepID=UPI001CCB6ED9|nr:hypothetical protein [Modicisalibacter sp. MOD 31.J]MBZ9574572.1 hypothetical protein [Modicisalibacter sp. MOD 31.J]